MTDSLRALERELMLLGRHHILPGAARRRSAASLDRSAYLLLSRLEAEGPMTIGQLAEAFSLDVSTVNRQAAALLQAGLAERGADPQGGLARKLTVTTEGARRVNENRSSVLAHLGDLVADWSPAEVCTFTELLERLNVGIEAKQGQRSWPRPHPVPASGD